MGGECMYRFQAKASVFLLLFHAGFCFGVPRDAKQVTVSSGAMFRIEVTRRTRLKAGREIRGRLLEPVYADNRLVVPSGALVDGTISGVRPAAHGKRLDAKFHGDFTPLNEPSIQWTTLNRSDGSAYSMLAESAAGAGSTLYFRSVHTGHTSLFRRTWNTFIGRKDSAVNTVKAPHKFERLQRYFWSQMPYHPQYLEEGAQYEMALTKELRLPAESPLPQANPDGLKPLDHLVSVHSRLRSDISSATAKAGDPVEAVVTAPVLDAQNQLLIAQDSILHGTVLRAVPSRRWGRSGTLRFSFTEVSWPSGLRQNVEATPTAIESGPETKLQVDEEGGVAQQTNRSVVAPLIMGLLSASALGDDDGGLGKAAVSSNGFALVGRLAAIGIGSRYVGGSIGAVATGRSIYTRFLAHGKDTHFGNDTGVFLEMSPAHAHHMTPAHSHFGPTETR
jgi:hypothetical protein